MHFHNRYHNRRLQRVGNTHAFPQRRTFKRCRATFAPHQLWSRSVAAIARGPTSIPLLHSPLKPALTKLSWTLQGFAAQRCQQHCHTYGTRNEKLPSSSCTAESPAHIRAGLGTCPSCCLGQHVLPVLRLRDQRTGAQQRQESLFALLASL